MSRLRRLRTSNLISTFHPFASISPICLSVLWPVLRRALSINVGHRHSTTGEFLNELENTRRRSTVRSLDAVSIDVGWKTFVGRAKLAVGAVNQDRVVVLRERVVDREVWIMIVADGVTYWPRVGRGERASEIACDVLVESIRKQFPQAGDNVAIDWPRILDRSCLPASEAIVADALGISDRPSRINDNDLMSTTALIGVLDGNELILANVGDSRAYLAFLTELPKQPTVDGDVAMSQLTQGIPPEQVHELGISGALRFCLGAARENDDGQLVPDRDRAHPMVSRWQLRPGDTIVLCSDGLVEERVFLEPKILLRPSKQTVKCRQQLADRLVDESDARQRLPSEAEPVGYGDNITCVVLRVVG